MGKKVLELFERSIIMQSLLTTGLGSAIVYLWVAGRAVPEEMSQAFWVILGFWFGTKVQYEVDNATARVRARLEKGSTV